MVGTGDGTLTQTLKMLEAPLIDPRDALAGLAIQATRHVAARQDVIREGEHPQHIYVLREGWASRYKTLPDGRRQTVAFFLPGDLFDMHVLALDRMDHNVAAITALQLDMIEREAFAALVAERGPLARALWRRELVSLAVQREWTLNVGRRSASERIAHLMCELYLRLRALGRAHGQSCDFPLTQVDIAEATGLTAVHVNRTLQELRQAGLIALQQRVLTIPDLNALKVAGLFSPNYLHL